MSLRNLVRVLAGGLIALLSAAVLTVVAHLLVALGMDPEAVYVSDATAPYLGLIIGSAIVAAWIAGEKNNQSWFSVSEKPWWVSVLAGMAVVLLLILLWLMVWCYLVGRSSMTLWWRQGVLGLTTRHLTEWGWALAAGLTGGVLGGRQLRRHTRQWLVFSALLLGVFGITLQIGVLARRAAEGPYGRPQVLTTGMQGLLKAPEPDGTTLRLLTFDFDQAPDAHFGLYDADSDDAVPFDDKDTVWMGQTREFVLDKLQRSAQRKNYEILCLFNAGFFGAKTTSDGSWVAHHEAPIVVGGKARYNEEKLVTDWPDQAWVLGIDHMKNVTKGSRFHLLPKVAWEELGSRFETAIVGVRPLRVDGNSVDLVPGMGATTLKCSRTSMAWTADGRRLYLLTIRDPDGEGASMRQRARGGEQNGGWDVHQVQEFWEQREIPNAVLFDGGESAQLSYWQGRHRYAGVRGGQHLSWTLGYIRQRPLRFYVPMLPAAQNYGGVLNYLYLERPRR